MVGQVLSHYKVLEEISRGGMGIVYRAVDTKLDREVALKIRENRGEMDEAREYYRRFYECWKGGDMDRESVDGAGRKLRELEVTS